ncbi:MAG: glycosyltransferase [Methanomassiliicoccales archaeon]
MRIAFFTDTYLPSRDGVVTSIMLTKKELERLGHEVYVFAPEPEKGAVREPGVFYFRSIGFRRYKGYRMTIFPTNKSEILQRLGIDVIHNHGLAFMSLRSMFAGRRLRKPVVTTWHTNLTEAVPYYNFTGIPDEVAEKLIWIYIRSLLRRSEAVIVPTEAIRRELERHVPGIRKLEVIPSGIDLTRFHPDLDGSTVRKRYGLEGKKVILHLGRIAAEKNIDLVLQGFASLAREREDVMLMVAGEGPYRPHCMQRAKELGVGERVIFTGFVPDEELPYYYASCDVFTIASKFETQGLVVLEAMACSKPVVGIAYRAVAELIRDGENGYLFQDGEESWKEAILKALKAPRFIGEAARRRAEEYSQEKSARKLIEVYEGAIESKRAKLQGRRP